LKVKAVEGVMALRKRAWHEEWTAYRLMQARVRGFVDQVCHVKCFHNGGTVSPFAEQYFSVFITFIFGILYRNQN